MAINDYIYVLIVSLIICTPPPAPEPIYEPYVYPATLVKNVNDSSSFKNLEDAPEQYVDKAKVVTNYLENGREEIHELSVTSKNLGENSHYNKYQFNINIINGQTLTLKSNSCHKLKASGEEGSDDDRDKCIPSFNTTDSQYIFKYNYELYKDEFIIINFTYEIKKNTQSVLYRKESASIVRYPGAECDYKFIFPMKYKDLGLQNNILNKESQNIYYYRKNCPNEQISDVIRFSPLEKDWKADVSYYLESTEILNDAYIKIPRYYKGGKIRNKNYKIMTYEKNELKESDLIIDEIFLKIELPKKIIKK